MPRTYASRSNARRAAVAECRRVLGPQYQPAEGPDYFIHPVLSPYSWRDRYRFEVRPVVYQEAERITRERRPSPWP